ncbi:hypothetical protein N0M98_10040, partial [Paenibacillus doosanensis]|uniref:hypothetical protein n=1 Tax=Paenibacillus doosanensis TaxID=1229154 RepID=UPI00217FAD2C
VQDTKVNRPSSPAIVAVLTFFVSTNPIFIINGAASAAWMAFGRFVMQYSVQRPIVPATSLAYNLN